MTKKRTTLPISKKINKTESLLTPILGKINKKVLLVCVLLVVLLTIPFFKRGQRWTYLNTYGIRLPLKYELHGIDVSHHQGSINWQKVKSARSKKARIDFCFIKATEGVSIKDEDFATNWQKVKQVGLKRGAYHFYIPWVSAKEQANSFSSRVSLDKGDLRPVLDFEIEGGKKHWPKMVENIQTWLRLVENKYGVKPIIYTNRSIYNKYIKGNFDEYPLWIAEYTSLELKGYKSAQKLFLWQHSQSGMVSGISGKVDFNVFLGTKGDFQEICM